MPARGRMAPLGAVCTTVAAKTLEELTAKAARAFSLGTDLVEFRIDLLAEIDMPRLARALGRLARRSVLTVRRSDEGGGFTGGDRERLALIADLADLRPRFLDIELATVAENPRWSRGLPGGTRKIISWHDFSGTPALSSLKAFRKRARKFGETVKIVTTAKAPDDVISVLELYRSDPRNLIAFCMGANGVASRVASLQFGSPVVYASLPNEPVAPGQLPVQVVVALKRLAERVAW
ncbi:MAG: type I 3-dehydroquinate dehydratase [Thaumarchaeota archaeon]|nr:type I 3-dehydroquinate dehydratase [Nitrososphaerota archaeon]